MSETIFDGATTPVETEVQSQNTTLPQELVEFVGEGKKYKSVEDALKSVPHAQTHIQKLEEEAKMLKEELAKRKAAEELLEDMRNGFVKDDGQQTKVELNPEIVEQTVASILAKKEAQTKAQTNVSKVVGTFEKEFGDKEKAQAMYLKVAEESGLSVQDLNRLAATSPDAVLKLAGLTNKANQPVGKIQSTVNSAAMNTSHQSQELSARVRQGATTRDLIEAWRIAGEKVKQKNGL